MWTCHKVCQEYIKFNIVHLQVAEFIIVLGFPKCPVQSLQNGQVKPNVMYVDPDTEVGYFCDKDHRLNGPSTRKCGRDGRLSKRQPTCTRKHFIRLAFAKLDPANKIFSHYQM